MANTNQIVSLQIQVTETGAIKVSTIAQDLSKLGQTAVDSSTGMVKLNTSMEKGTISGREMSMAIGSISEAFGVTNPVMSQGLIHATRFFDAVKEGSVSSRITAGAVIGIGTAIAMTMAAFEKGEDIAKRFAEIQRISDAMDLKNITGELAKTSVELETQSRVWDSWSGAAITVIKRMGLQLLGIPNDVEVALQSMEKLRAGLERALPFADQAEAAKHSGTMTGLQASGMQAYYQNLLATAQLPIGSETAYSTTFQNLIEKERQAAIGVANAKRLMEFSEAGVTGAADILDPSAQKRYDDAVAEIDMKARGQLESLSGTVMRLGQSIVTSNANVMGIQLKYVADVGAAWRGGEELKQTLMLETTAWTLNETDKRLADVDKWERESLAKVREKEGYTRESEALEEQVVSAASTRRIQISQEGARKIQDQLRGQTDSFEEAYRLQGAVVKVTQEGMLGEWEKTFKDLDALYVGDTTGYRAALVLKEQDLKAQLDDGRLSQENYFLILQGLRSKDSDLHKKQIDTDLAAQGVQINQFLAAEAYRYNETEKIRQTNLTNLATYYLAISARDSDYWAGMKSGMVSAYAQLGTFWEDWAKGWQTATLNTRDLLSSELFDVLRGDFAQAGKDAENFGKALLKVFTDIVANAATRELLSLLLGSGTGTLGGNLLGLGTTAVGAAAGGGGGGGGALGMVSSGASLAGTGYSLAGGKGLLGLFSGGGTGVSNTLANNLWLGQGAAEAAATAAAEGSIYAGLTGATLADISGAPIGAAVGATAGATTGATVGAAAGIGPLAGAALVTAPLVIGSIVMAITDKLYKEKSQDTQAQDWAMTYNAVLTNFGGLPGAITYANSEERYSQDWQGYLDTLQRWRTSGPATALEQMEAADLNSIYPGWYNLPGWDRFDYASTIAQRKSDADAAQAAAMLGGSDGGGRAAGGPVWPGLVTTVAEQGPEPVVWGANGYVLNHQEARDIYAGAVSARAGGGGDAGGGNTYNLNITIHAEGSLADPAGLAEFVREKIKPELVHLDRLRHGSGWSN